MVDTKKLAGAIRGKRGKASLRQVAPACGVSFPALCRIENEEEPDLDNFIKLCRWLGVPMEYFTIREEQAETA